MTSQLENDRKTYVNYIETVSEICNLGFILDDMKRVKKLSLRELDALSKEIEELYDLHLHNKAADRLIKEVEEFGADYVKKKYLEET